MQQPESIDILATEARDQLAAQFRHYERLDAQAATLLGFAGLFVALAPESASMWLALARLAAVVAATGALLTFTARAYPSIDLVELRKMLSAEPVLAELVLLDTRIVFVEEARQRAIQKAKRLKVTTFALLTAILLAVLGLFVDNPS